MEYGDILTYIENLIDSIEYDDISLPEIKNQLQELVAGIEETVENSEDLYDGFDFDEMD